MGYTIPKIQLILGDGAGGYWLWEKITDELVLFLNYIIYCLFFFNNVVRWEVSLVSEMNDNVLILFTDLNI